MMTTTVHPSPVRSSTMRSKDYVARWRASHPEGREREKRAAAARRAALTRLARQYPGSFAALVDEERAKRDLPPVQRR